MPPQSKSKSSSQGSRQRLAAYGEIVLARADAAAVGFGSAASSEGFASAASGARCALPS